MSSGLVLCTPLAEDPAVFTPLKPVTMSGEPGEDPPVFEDIKPPSRPLENPPDLAQYFQHKQEKGMTRSRSQGSWSVNAGLAKATVLITLQEERIFSSCYHT
ncbi:hypothetical protein BTVI_58144 [Pitangus sulphuratus]|nr:hypothetical protein BTVI_58144 [Pitangus sulphuratus]